MEARTVIAFDYGTKRIGIAIGQELTRTATPLTTLDVSAKSPESSRSSGPVIDWSSIDQLIQEWQPQAVVVGLPLAADGSETRVTLGAKAFGEALQKRYNLATYWVDERLTSVDAERMIAASPPGSKRTNKSVKKSGKGSGQDKGEIDRMAAKIILESWFNQQANQ